MAAFMEYEGIKGSATAKGYESMIKLDHAQFDVKRTISMEVGNLKNRESTRPAFNILEATKFDGSTALILQELFTVHQAKS